MLHNKTALVTGAASGFGQGIAAAMIEAGAQVGILDMDEHAAAQTAEHLGDAAMPLVADITDPNSLQSAVETLTEQWGPLDILVNNAGIGLAPAPLEEISYEQFKQLNAVNMDGIFHTSQAIVPGMKSRQRGCILNIASTAGVSPRPNLTWYNATKGWVITATRSMAIELAPSNIRVNAINPVAGDTPLLKTFMGEDTPEQRNIFLNTIPLGRFSTPQDIGQAAVFLCSDAASLITGVALEIDGGRCI